MFGTQVGVPKGFGVKIVFGDIDGDPTPEQLKQIIQQPSGTTLNAGLVLNSNLIGSKEIGFSTPNLSVGSSQAQFVFGLTTDLTTNTVCYVCAPTSSWSDIFR